MLPLQPGAPSSPRSDPDDAEPSSAAAAAAAAAAAGRMPSVPRGAGVVVQGAAPPPPGVTPDLAHPTDVLHTVNIVAQIMSIVLVSAFVMLRTYAKAVLAPPFLLDDLHHYGGGYHIWEVSVEDYVGFLKSLYADTVVYGPNAYFTKVALLLVIARVFHTFTATRVVAHALMGAMALYYLPVLLIKINVCRPIAAFWTPSSLQSSSASGDGRAAATCLDQDDLFVADTVLSALTDFAVLALPIPATMSLRLPLRRRLRVWAMLGLGGVATLASIVRMIVVIRLHGDDADQTVEFVRFNLLGTAEVSIGLICACLPALNILHTKWQQLRPTASASEGWSGATGDGSKKSLRLRSLKFLHGSRLHTAPPLSAVVVTPGSDTTTATDATYPVDGKHPPEATRADVQRAAPYPRPPPRAYGVNSAGEEYPGGGRL